MTTNFWDERFSQSHYIYGEQPNAFLAAQADRFPAGGCVLSLGEGEGRNAVFLAGRGLRLTAIDGSPVGQEKMAALAARKGVQVELWLGDVASIDLGRDRWEGVLNVFCHLPSGSRRTLYGRIRDAIKPGGVYVTEQFTPGQLAYESGGPKDPDLLLSLVELEQAFAGWSLEVAEEAIVDLDEGPFHQGPASVVRFVARKPV